MVRFRQIIIIIIGIIEQKYQQQGTSEHTASAPMEKKERINAMHLRTQFSDLQNYLLICLQFSLQNYVNQNCKMYSQLQNIFASNYSRCLPICIHVQYSGDLQFNEKTKKEKKSERACNYVSNGGPKNIP
jgi:hypothetical protein